MSAVARAFGLSRPARNPLRHILEPEAQARAVLAARNLYDRTQAALEDAGLREIRLFRGVRSATRAVGVIQSWTTDLNVAIRFDGFDVLEATIGARQILAFDRGPLWERALSQRESEYIVITESLSD